jgi:hypothetical protein
MKYIYDLFIYRITGIAREFCLFSASGSKRSIRLLLSRAVRQNSWVHSTFLYLALRDKTFAPILHYTSPIDDAHTDVRDEPAPGRRLF